MADPSPGRDGVEWIADQLKELRAAIRELQAPSGTQIYNTVSKLAAMINDIQAQLDAWTSTRYTNAQVDAKDAATLAAARTSNIDNGTTGSVRTGDLFAAQAPGFNITANRVAAWIQSTDGRLGTASSSRRYKQDIAPADIDPASVFALEPRRFRYIEQVKAHGPDAAGEYGFIAEELENLGLTPWVVYRDIDGETVPDGVSYSMLPVAQQAAIRDLHDRDLAKDELIRDLADRVVALEKEKP